MSSFGMFPVMISARAIQNALQPRLEDIQGVTFICIGSSRHYVPGGRIDGRKILICSGHAELIVTVDTYDEKLGANVHAKLELGDEDFDSEVVLQQMDEVVEHVTKSLERWMGEEEID